MVRGFLVNRFRGDPALFADGMELIAARTGWEALGLIPHFPDAARLPRVVTRLGKRGLSLARLGVRCALRWDRASTMCECELVVGVGGCAIDSFPCSCGKEGSLTRVASSRVVPARQQAAGERAPRCSTLVGMSRSEVAGRIHRVASDTPTLSPECQTHCHPDCRTGSKPHRTRFSGRRDIQGRS